jgi:hypothetical protein
MRRFRFNKYVKGTGNPAMFAFFSQELVIGLLAIGAPLIAVLWYVILQPSWTRRPKRETPTKSRN